MRTLDLTESNAVQPVDLGYVAALVVFDKALQPSHLVLGRRDLARRRAVRTWIRLDSSMNVESLLTATESSEVRLALDKSLTCQA